MNPSDAIRGTAWEDTDLTCMARAKLNGAVASFIQSAISAIERKIFDRTSATPGTALSTTAVVVADSVFDTLQTDGRWTEDSTGYNFRDTIPAASLASGSSQYRVEYKVTTTSGSIFFLVFEVTSFAVFSG
jgi:hypothetical protein